MSHDPANLPELSASAMQPHEGSSSLAPAASADSSEVRSAPFTSVALGHHSRRAGSSSDDGQTKTRTVRIHSDLMGVLDDATEYGWREEVLGDLEQALEGLKREESERGGFGTAMTDSKQPELFWQLRHFIKENLSQMRCYFSGPKLIERSLGWSYADGKCIWEDDAPWVTAASREAQNQVRRLGFLRGRIVRLRRIAPNESGEFDLGTGTRDPMAVAFEIMTVRALRERHDRLGEKDTLGLAQRRLIADGLYTTLGNFHPGDPTIQGIKASVEDSGSFWDEWWSDSLKGGSRDSHVTSISDAGGSAYTTPLTTNPTNRPHPAHLTALPSTPSSLNPQPSNQPGL